MASSLLWEMHWDKLEANIVSYRAVAAMDGNGIAKGQSMQMVEDHGLPWAKGPST